MPGFGDIVQKALYLGVGIASYAGEKANQKLAELRVQVQKLADELVARGEMSTEEARKFVDDMMKQASQQPASTSPEPTSEKPKEPRRIEIVSEDEESSGTKKDDVEQMRNQVEALQEELRRLKREGK